MIHSITWRIEVVALIWAAAAVVLWFYVRRIPRFRYEELKRTPQSPQRAKERPWYRYTPNPALIVSSALTAAFLYGFVFVRSRNNFHLVTRELVSVIPWLREADPAAVAIVPLGMLWVAVAILALIKIAFTIIPFLLNEIFAAAAPDFLVYHSQFSLARWNRKIAAELGTPRARFGSRSLPRLKVREFITSTFDLTKAAIDNRRRLGELALQAWLLGPVVALVSALYLSYYTVGPDGVRMVSREYEIMTPWPTIESLTIDFVMKGGRLTHPVRSLGRPDIGVLIHSSNGVQNLNDSSSLLNDPPRAEAVLRLFVQNHIPLRCIHESEAREAIARASVNIKKEFSHYSALVDVLAPFCSQAQ